MKKLLITLLLVLTVACQESPVASSLSQHEAHDVVSHLNHYGIESRIDQTSKSKSQSKKYTVLVDDKNYLASIDIIHQLDLISMDNEEFKDLTESSAIVPSKQYELYRLDRSLAVQIEEALVNMPDIQRVKAVVRLRSVAEGQIPAVSLVVKGSVDLELVRQIKSFIR